MKRIAHFLIKYRHFLLVVMTALFVVSIFQFPKINVVSDMTTYLPDDSRMKQGLARMKEAFSGIDMNAAGVNAMFTNDAVDDSLATELSEIEGVATIMSQRSNEKYTLYQFVLNPGASADTVASVISERYSPDVTVETAALNLLPENMDFIIIAGVSLLTLILVVMCSSIMEVILFLVAIGIAVGINIGTNAFLPGVSMVTNAIAAVLQLILSMDYSIILMNRYRQTKNKTAVNTEAMALALADATPTILSSALTTMLGMGMLAFMKFKIGLDMGLVLSKGVFLSLVSVYLVLPALVLAFDKAIRKTEKRVPLVHTYKLSKFEEKFRVLIAAAFVVFFVGSYILSKRTSIGFSSTWPTEISREFPPQNQIVLLYESGEEEKVIPLVDSLNSDPNVVMAMSYPSIMLKERTADELVDFIGSMSSMLPAGAQSVETPLPVEDLLNILYYAAAHPQRDERMSFTDIEEFVSNLPEEMAGGFDIDGMMESVMEQFLAEEEVAEEEIAETIVAVPDTLVVPDSLVSPADTAVILAAAPDTTASAKNESRFTARNSTRALTSAEMAEFLGFEPKQASAIYRMAGKAKSVMTPQEFVRYVNDEILTRNIYAMMISDEQKKEFVVVRHQIDSAVVAGVVESLPVPATDTLMMADAEAVVTVPVDTLVQEKPAEAAPAPVKIETPPTPLEILMDMVASGKKYSSVETGSTLRNAGVEVAQSDVDLLFLYYGATHSETDTLRMSISGILDFVTGPLLTDPMYGRFIDDSAREGISGLKQSLAEGLGNLRGEKFSMATIISDYEIESDGTFAFIAGLSAECDRILEGENYLIGESVMYKEMSDGFEREMMVVTWLTIIVIFLVVALTFRSMIVPVFLLLIVLSATYVCAFIGGLGGKSLNYLAYLVTQSILMGATIDYAILFTNYYREKRMKLPIGESLRKSYKTTTHTIMTSGLILILCPYIMSVLLTDPTISSILESISVGALSAILLIVFVLPGLLAAFDKIIKK